MKVVSIVVCAIISLVPVRLLASEPTAATTSSADIHQQLREALVGARQAPGSAGLEKLEALAGSSSFQELTPSDQHLALQSTAQLALQLKNADAAQRYAKQACSLPDATPDDWALRLRAAQLLGDVIDQTQSVTTLIRAAGARSDLMPAAAVTSALRQSGSEQYQQYYYELLHAVYDRQWLPGGDVANDGVRLAETLMWLQAGDLDRAASVAQQIGTPTDLITMQVDLRFKPLFGWRSHYSKLAPQKALRAEIDRYKQQVAQYPHSIDASTSLSNDLRGVGQPQDALNATRDTEQSLNQSGLGPKDPSWLKKPYLLIEQSYALQELGKPQDALDNLYRALEMNHEDVGTALDLAASLSEFGDPAKALELLPADSKASAYGRMVIDLIRATTAQQLGESDAEQAALSYLQAHAADARTLALRALIRCNRLDDAETLLVQMLNDPIQRLDALRFVQIYAPPKGGPLETQWQGRLEQLRQRPAVLQAAKQVGAIDSFPWHPPLHM